MWLSNDLISLFLFLNRPGWKEGCDGGYLETIFWEKSSINIGNKPFGRVFTFFAGNNLRGLKRCLRKKWMSSKKWKLKDSFGHVSGNKYSNWTNSCGKCHQEAFGSTILKDICQNTWALADIFGAHIFWVMWVRFFWNNCWEICPRVFV